VLRGSSRAPSTEPASALLMAALAATLLATAAALLLLDAQAARNASAEGVRLARAQLEADAALAEAIVRLDAGELLPPQGAIISNENGARVYRQDAAGLIDVNAAEPETLARLLQSLGVTQERAAQLGAAIADWRDVDDLVRSGGAESAQYASAGLEAPANRAFETEGEIVRVLGVAPALARCALPFLTTYSGQWDVETAAAPDALRDVLGLAASEAPSSAAPLGRVIILRAEAPLSEHAVVRRTLWIRLTGDPERPLLVHRAQQDLAPHDDDPSRCAERTQ
jgi:hypothetical protein